MKTKLTSILIALCLGVLCATPFSAQAQCPPTTITVTTTNDSGPGSLRQAIIDANLCPDANTINFASSVSNTITLTSGEFFITGPVNILGPGADVLAINGNFPIRTNRVFSIGPGINVTISGLTITSGTAISDSLPASSGGGIYNDRSTLTVSSCTLSGNSASRAGGAIVNASGAVMIINSTLSGNSAGAEGGCVYNTQPVVPFIIATLTIHNSTVHSNWAGSGGAIYNDRGRATITSSLLVLNSALSGFGGGIEDSFGSTTIINSTLTGNTSLGGGGAFDPASSSATVRNCTIVGNTSQSGRGGGINANHVNLTLQNSIVANNTAGSLALGPDIDGVVTAGDYNLIGNTSGLTSLPGTNNITGLDPMLGTLQQNGGPTLTLAPLTNSPVIDAGDNNAAAGLTTDQRGYNRVAGNKVDIGAVEFGSCPLLLEVTTSNDSGPGSLRQAILDANACVGKQVIMFATNAYGTITLTSGELFITDDVDILGPDATNVAVNGGFPATTNRVFQIGSGIQVTIVGLTITNGRTDNQGAGIFNSGTLTLGDCIVSDNVASHNGGGILNAGSLTVTGCTLTRNTSLGGGAINTGGAINPSCFVINSTISSNNSTANGGGITVDGGTITIHNSTLSGNSATGVGGGIYTGGVADVSGCTIVQNSGLRGGGILNNATLILNSSIVASNTASPGPDIKSGILTLVSGDYNLIGNTNGIDVALPGTHNIIDEDPMLGPLQDNGGPTFTHALLCGSPAIDQGTNFSASATDQTGFPRTFNVPAIANASDGTDIGAYELLNTDPVALCTNVTLIASTNCTVTVTPSDVDNGSSDPDGDTLTKFVSPTNLTGSGMHTVTLIVTDCHGASNSCTATVKVLDITPPSLACPSNKTVNATGPSGVVTNYPAGATDACGAPVVTYDIAGTPITWPYNFPIGTNTTVNVTATDAATNVASCSFTVHVKGAAEQINDLIAKVNALPGVKSPNKKALVSPLQTALAALAAKDKPSACKAMQAFINLVKAQAEKKLISAADAAALTADALRIRAVIGCP